MCVLAISPLGPGCPGQMAPQSIITGISYFRLSLEEQRLAQAKEKRFDVTL